MTIALRVPALLLTLAAAAALALLATPPAFGGGFSTVTLDPLPEAPRAGETIGVGYTVRGHGVTPMPAPGSGIAVVGADGTRTSFRGNREGPAGHYAAEVRFPSSGSWAWEAVQDEYTVQQLGRVEVAPAASQTGPEAAGPQHGGGGPGAGAWALLSATVVAAALLAGVALRPRRAPAG